MGFLKNIFNMIIEITIECDDELEMLGHLSVVRKQIKREIKKFKDGCITNPLTIEDSNCYGDHTINIIPDCTLVHFPDGNGFCLSCGDQLSDYIE